MSRIYLARPKTVAKRRPGHNRLLLESTLLLSLVSAAFSYAWLRLSGDRDTLFWVPLIVPASASVAFPSVLVLVPSVLAVGHFRWPLMLTLPLVYSALLQLCAALWFRGPNPIVQFEIIGQACTFWQRPITALGLFVCQILVFSVRALIAGRDAVAE